MGALLGFFGTPLRLKALLIGAAVMALVCMTLLVWALWERSSRLSLEVEAVTLRGQNQVLADSLGRCNAGVEAAAKAGTAALADMKRLVAIAEKAAERTAALRNEIKGIVNRPAPKRADGKPKDCTDAMSEIRQKVQP